MFGKGVPVDATKAFRERDLAFGRDGLTAQHDDRMRIEGIVKFFKRRVVKAGGKVDAANFRAARIAARDHLERTHPPASIA